MDIAAQGLVRVHGSGGSLLRALDGVSLVVSEPAAVAVQGPSGSGKSTLLHLLGGLDRPDEGSLVVGGVDVPALRGRALADYRRSIGFVFQGFHLLPALSALENVLLPVVPRRVRTADTSRARALLTQVGLGTRAEARPGELSGGEQQRVAIARALMGSPSLILADEPTGNLDSRTAHDIVELLLTVRSEVDAVLVVATHDPGVAARCDRLLVLRDGRVTDDDALGPPALPDDTWRHIARPGAP